MKTKFFILLFATIANIGTLSAWWSYDCVLIDDLYYNLDSQKKIAEVTWESRVTLNYMSYQYNNGWNITTANIPSSVVYEGVEYVVTGIGEGAFASCSNLTSVTISNGVTSIGQNAFYQCRNLESVSIPENLVSIGENAFYGCNHLISIEWNAINCTNISTNSQGHSPFSGGSSTITSFVFGDKVEYVPAYLCSGLRNIPSIEIPKSIETIEDSAFEGCEISTIIFKGNIEEWCVKEWASGYISEDYQLMINGVVQQDVIIPNSVTRIGDYAFSGCTSLTSIIIPDSVTSIGDAAFANCIALAFVTISNNVTTIKEGTFFRCTNLTNIAIPNGVTSIEYNAFYGCTGLTGIAIGSSVIDIDNEAFYGCDNMTSVTINSNAFIEAAEGKDYGSKSISSVFGQQVTQYIIGDDVTHIGRNVFSGCNELLSVIIGNSVTYIGKEAFSNCGKLTSVTMGNSLISIRESAFKNCTSLTSVVFGSSLDTIGNNAFYNCLGVSSLSLPNSVKYIGNRAFYNWNDLISITLQDSIKFIGEEAFMGWKGSSLEIPKNVEHIESNAFVNENLTTVTIHSNHLIQNPQNEYSHGDSRFKSRLALAFGSQVKKYIVGDDVMAIGYGAFANCEELTSIILPNTIKYIGDAAFEECGKLSSITIPKTVKSIGDYAFVYCTSLTSVVIPDSVVSIGERSFGFCSNLESITIPESLTQIYDGDDSNYASFGHSWNIKEIYYTGNVKQWCEKPWSMRKLVTAHAYTLYIENKKVTNLIIPNGTTFIGECAFEDCGSLTSVTIPATVTSVGQGAFQSSNLSSIISYATTPPIYTGESLSLCNFDNVILYVPSGSIPAYSSANEWRYFYYRSQILGIGASSADVSTTTIITGEDLVDILWPIVSGAVTYELTITDSSGNVICTLTFDADGLLLTINYNAPSRNGAPRSTQSTGFTFTVSGLESGTSYSYTLTAKGESGNTIHSETGAFTTTGNSPTALNETMSIIKSSKLLHDGQIYIQHGDKIYTLQGLRVR